jgi:tetratricopeptide (TPR) repeat protein
MIVRPAAVILLILAGLVGPLEAQRIKLPLGRGELEARAQLDSLDAAAHYNVALAYWNEKRFDDADRELRLAVTLDPKFAEGYLALAYLPYAQRPKLWSEARDRVPEEWKQRLEESDRLYRRAFLVNPMVDLRIAGAVTMPRDAVWEALYPGVYEFYFQAFDDMLQGNYEQAYGRFTKLHRERRIAGPGQGKLPMSFHWFEGLAAAHTQRWPIAKQRFEYLIDESVAEEKKLEEKDLVRIPLRTNEYRYFLANISHAAGEIEQALELYRKTLESDLGLYMAHVQMANIYESQRRYPEAIEERKRAVNANPDDPSLVMDLGVTLGKSGNFAEGEAVLKQAAEANPRDPRVSFWAGLCQAEQGKREDAKASLSRFISTAPSRWDKQIGMAKQRLAALQ